MSKAKEYGERYLYSEDLLSGGEYHTVTVEIAECLPAGTLTAANGKKIDKPTLRFAGKDKLLVLCATNVSMIVFCTGEHDPAKWVGRRVTLQPRIVEAFGDQVVAIRVIPPAGLKVRRSVLKRLGDKAVWKSGETA